MNTFTKLSTVALGAALIFGFGMASVSTDAAAAWKPKKPVQFIIMAGKGGGADKAVRYMQSIIAKNKLSSKPFTPINKPGGSGAEALVFVKNTSDPDHTIMFTLNSFYTTPLRNPKLGVDISKFTPIGRMAEDTFLLWANKSSGITNVKQFVKAAKAKGSAWIMQSSRFPPAPRPPRVPVSAATGAPGPREAGSACGRTIPGSGDSSGSRSPGC